MKNSNFFLKVYAITLTFILAFFVIYGFKTGDSKHTFDEITVRRINIVEPDVKLTMVISNSDQQHPGMFNGEPIMERSRPPGIIFFNEEQDEVGGLIYHGNKNDGAEMVLSFDQYKNDQVMQMLYQKNDEGKQKYGMNLWDRSEVVTLPVLIQTMDSLEKVGISDPHEVQKILEKINDGNSISAQRMFTGKNYEDHVGVFIKDEFGKDRIKIYIDENNDPQFLIYDKEGKITDRLKQD